MQTPRHTIRTLGAALCALAAVLALTAVSASASYVHKFEREFGASGSGAGQLSSPGGIAVDSATHDVYVADTGNRRVDEFTSAGGFVRAWGWGVADGFSKELQSCTLTCFRGLSGSGAGEFVTPTNIAVDNSGGPSQGDVYVADPGDAVVSKFDAEGNLVAGWGEGGQLSEAPTGAGGAEEPFGMGEGVGGVAVNDTGQVIFRGKLGLGREYFYEFEQGGVFVERIILPSAGKYSGLAVSSASVFYAIAADFFADEFGEAGEEFGEINAPAREYTEHRHPGEIRTPANPAVGLALDSSFNDPLDPSSNDLYVDLEGSSIVRYATSCEPLLSSNGCTPSDSFGSGDLSGAGELGVDGSSHVVYAVESAAGVVKAFAAFVAPDVLTQAVSEVKGSTVTLHGMVDANGVALSDCHFDYGTSTSYGQSTPCVPAAGSIADSSPHAVSAQLTGLTPGTTYHFRLRAANANCAICSATGADETFTTLPPPSIDGAETRAITTSSATLAAKINPKGSATEYRFEWGTSTAYGHTVPVPDGVIVAGSADVAVETALAGLSANTTYHWRIVASNENGTATSPDQTFVYDTSGGGLPDGRAYEMVTPPAKNGALIGSIFIGVTPQVAEDGSTVVASSIQCFGGSESCVASRQSEGEPYAFTRTSNGWVTTALAPPVNVSSTNTSFMAGVEPTVALFSAPTPPAGEDDWYERRPDGSFVDVGPLTSPTLGPTDIASIGSKTLVATADLSHIVYEADNAQWPFDESAGSSVYEYSGAARHGSPELVAVSGGPGSHDLISRCISHVGSGGNEPHNNYGALSADGKFVYFTAIRCGTGTGVNEGVKVPANELYARIEGSRTQLISGRDPGSCTSPACTSSQAADAMFEGASADGSRVLFTSTQQLMNEASQDPVKGDSATVGCQKATGANGCNLYEMEGVGSATPRLVDVSAGDTSGGGPRVQGVVAISSDASHVYFIAKGVLTSTPNIEGQAASDGALNLYVYERDASFPAGRIAFIAGLSAADDQQWSEGIGYANVTPDGRFLAFTSHRGLTKDATRAEGPAQVYEYDAQSGALVRISKGQEGFNDNGNAGVADASILAASRAFFTRAGPARPDPTMSHDGAYVFFQSPVGLTPQALNDVQIGKNGLGQPVYAQNIYEWHEGQVSLISDGHDTSQLAGGISAVELIGSDATGSNVFFTTADPLVPADTDTQRDYYDARICTPTSPCIKPAAPPSPPCLGEQCHGTPAATPPLFAAPTVTFNGQGNLIPPAPAAKVKPKNKKPAKCAKGKVRKHGKCVKARAKRGKKAGITKHAARVKSNRRSE